MFDIATDPGETTDLSAKEAARFAEMQVQYADYAKADRVLPMPDGYTAPKQIRDNAIKELLVPRLLKLAPYALAILIAIGGLMMWRRRRKRAA